MTQDFQRLGLDFQLERGPWVAYGTWIDGDDDVFDGLTKTGSQSNSAAYLETFYVFSQNGDPTFVPLIRWETSESNNGLNSTDAIASALQYYVRSNVNFVLEYWTETSVPTGQKKNNRATLMFNVLL